MKILKDFDILCYTKNFTLTPFCVHVHLELLLFGTCSLKMYLQEQMGKSIHSLQSFRFRPLKIDQSTSKVCVFQVSNHRRSQPVVNRLASFFRKFMKVLTTSIGASTNTSISKMVHFIGKYNSSFIQSLKMICINSLLSPSNLILQYTI